MSTSLDDVNDGFHASYDRARHEAKLQGPVFVVLADQLIVFHHGEKRVLGITPPIFHVIKAVAHAPVALYAALLLPAPEARVSALREHLAASLASLDETAQDAGPTAEDLRAILASTLAFAERVLAPGAHGPIAKRELDAFAREQGTKVLALTTAATRVQLAALDAAVDEALVPLDAEDRRALQVVVTGDHQARVRALGMQYFRKRFREREGAEDRVTYAEGVTDVEEALALVGTRRLDNAIALAFFGNAKRLQRDVLGDAVHALLEESERSFIG